MNDDVRADDAPTTEGDVVEATDTVGATDAADVTPVPAAIDRESGRTDLTRLILAVAALLAGAGVLLLGIAALTNDGPRGDRAGRMEQMRELHEDRREARRDRQGERGPWGGGPRGRMGEGGGMGYGRGRGMGYDRGGEQQQGGGPRESESTPEDPKASVVPEGDSPS